MTPNEHFQTAHDCAKLIADGKTPILRNNLVNALIQSLKAALKGMK